MDKWGKFGQLLVSTPTKTTEVADVTPKSGASARIPANGHDRGPFESRNAPKRPRSWFRPRPGMDRHMLITECLVAKDALDAPAHSRDIR